MTSTPQQTSKTCTVCKESIGLDNFHKDNQTKDGHASRCKPCNLAYNKAYREKKGKAAMTKLRFKSSIKQLYGITYEEYEAMLEKQNGQCAICGTTDPSAQNNRQHFCVDHCHTTGQVRGLLCDQCNTALGKFKDNINYLENAITYLQQTKSSYA